MGDKSTSPIGWYVASYLIRFVELDEPAQQSGDDRVLAWENTIIVRADNIEHAYDKVIETADQFTKSYKGGPEGVDVKWELEGVTELLPIYEDLEDGSEIMYKEHSRKKLKTLRKKIRKKNEFLRLRST